MIEEVWAQIGLRILECDLRGPYILSQPFELGFSLPVVEIQNKVS